jgi:hypothetical protein
VLKVCNNWQVEHHSDTHCMTTEWYDQRGPVYCNFLSIGAGERLVLPVCVETNREQRLKKCSESNVAGDFVASEFMSDHFV